MIRSFLVAAAITAAVPVAAQAALSGFHDRAEQITTILQSTDVANTARQAPIESLEFDGQRNDRLLKWEADFGECDLDIYLQAHAPQGVGKTTYTVARIQADDDCR
ncbi:hypothetical protein BVG79_01231 [Ketogulonicigenium robustum]|uniref:Uncharacterized protein n=1 Tax=Ketogulonicigenium robustum TaxID=92947 RepID=A0A1W6NZY6_9RHOB|nr:hypothetical protein [Ketogulonicigenium robustum]ARO14577.1 hypothetical protein BVG79_01231 [Ketogulonicigenium robustum]